MRHGNHPERIWKVTNWNRSIGVAAGAIVLASGIWWVYSQRPTPRQPVERAYVDAATCAGCHQAIWETYRQTGMGRSFYRPRPEHTALPGAFYHKASDRYYTIRERDGRYLLRRHQIGPQRGEVNVIEKEIHWVVGSGNHARTFLHRTPEGRIVELPLAWYAAGGGRWGMNPGYDRPDHEDFRRAIRYECMFCHNAYPEIAPGADASGSEPLFPARLPEGIDCQRCHGPGREHLRAAANRQTPEVIRAAILNPARLSRRRQLEVCLQCHLETTPFRLPHAILRYERGAFSYRAGEPLGGFVLHFDHAPGASYWDDKFDIAHHGYRLAKSPCFAKSNGQLMCTTCHNPHQSPRAETAAAHYRAACRTCHAQPHTTADCRPCHMPRRRTDDVVQVVMTDHFIQRRKPGRDLLAPLAERYDSEQTAYRGEVVAYYPSHLPAGPDELYVAIAQVKHKANLAEGIPRLEQAIEKHRPDRVEFYFELAEAYWEGGQKDKALAAYEDALRRRPDFWPALHSFGRALAKTGQLSRAEETLHKALARTSRNAIVLNDLALVQIAQGRGREAAETLRRAVAIDPDFPDAHNNLGNALAAAGDKSEAEAAYREAIRAQPDFAPAHKNLANLLTGSGQFSTAGYHYEKAIQFDPKFAAARYDYGLALAQQERFDQARRQFEVAVELKPNLAEAHKALGDLAAMKGDSAAAARHFRRAIAVRPDYDEANLNLGQLLALTGRRVEALRYLEKAAESPDPAIREAARQAAAGPRR